MALPWDQWEVCFTRGGGGVWHPDYPSLSRDWFRRHLVDYDFWYISHGQGYIRDEGGQTTPLRPGVCIWMRPGSIFEVWRKPRSRFGTRYFHFDLRDVTGRAVQPDELHEAPLSCDMAVHPHVEALTRRMTDMLVQMPLVGDESLRAGVRLTLSAMLKSLLMDFTLTAGMNQARSLQGVDEDQVRLSMHLLAQIHEHAGQFDIEPFIARSGYSRDHFRRLFRRVVGQTPHQAVLSARINRAKVLLRQTQLPIGSVADQLGYANVQYFSLHFKQAVGVSPSSYRAALHDAAQA